MRLRIKELIEEKAVREKRDINQKVAATEAGVDPSILSRYSRGFSTSVNMIVLEKLKKYFNVSFDDLLEIVEDAQ